jgi:fibronectin-binding autotransporter adhesin
MSMTTSPKVPSLSIMVAISGALLAVSGAASAGTTCTDLCITGDVQLGGLANPATAVSVSSTTVDGTAGPWDTGINPGYPYGDGAQTTPASIDLVGGALLYTVAATGTTSTDRVNFVDANGDLNNPPLGPGSNAPGAYIANGVTSLNALVGTFTASSGAIVGAPVVIGVGPTLVAPSSGATQLQLGINDNQYSDNTGSLSVTVNGYVAGSGTTIVGNTDAGTLTITTGVYATGSLIAGSEQGSTGTITNAGVLIDDAVIGDGGAGSMTNTGNHYVSGNLILGNQSTGNGTYTINGNSAQTVVNFVPGGNGGNPNGALIIGNAGTGNFTQGYADLSDPLNQVTVAGDLVLGQQLGSNGSYTLNTGTLSVGGQLAVGGQGTGMFTQYAGTVNLTGSASGNPDYVSVGPGEKPYNGTLAVGGGIGSSGDGSNDGGTGTYTLDGGAINISNNFQIGGTGNGTFNQNGGSVTTYDMTLGFTGNGTYVMTAGTLQVNDSETIGGYGTGSFSQSDGTHTVAGTLSLGDNCCGMTGGGTYTMTGGTLTASDLIVGNVAPSDASITSGAFSMSDSNDVATTNVSGNLTIGGQAGATGSYTITGNTAQTNVYTNPGGDGAGNPYNGALIVGNAGMGTFTQGLFIQSDPGNQVYVQGDLALGLQQGSQGTYTLNIGTLTVDGLMIVGAASTNDNEFIQNGGTVNLTNTANSGYVSVSPGAAGGALLGTLIVGGEQTSDNGTGTYTINAGTLDAFGIAVGWSGTGTFNQNGGVVNAGGLDMGDCGGCNGGNSAGFYNLNGTGALFAGSESIGDFGHAEFVQGMDGNGNTTNTVYGTLSIGNGPTATPNSANPGNWDRSGTYTLDSGILNTKYTVVASQGTGSFFQNGGTHAVSNTLTIGQQNSQPLSGPLGSGTHSNPVFGGPAPGVYTMTGGILTAGGDPSIGVSTRNAGIIVGDAGNGTFNQIAGSVTSGVANGQRGDLVIGAQDGSTGNYNLGDSSNGIPNLQVYGDTIIGRDAAGSVTVPDPNNNNNPVTVPLDAANGSLTIAGNGTTMRVNQTTGFDSHNGGNMLVALNGVAAVVQTDASTVYMDHNLVIGANAGSSGTYTLNATSITNGANSGYNLFVGSDVNIGGMLTDAYGSNFQTTPSGGTGTFTQNSGDVSVVGAVNVGNSGGTGTYALNNGTLTVANSVNIGTDGGTGTVKQDSGIVTTQGMDIGQAGGLGEYDLNGGVLNSTETYVSGNSTGTFNQTGGTFNAGYLNVGILGGGTGTYTMTGGSLNVAGNLGVGGANAQGTFTQSAGTVEVGVLYVNNDPSQTSHGGSYAISGGSFTVDNDAYIGNANGSPSGGNGGTFTVTGGDVVIGTDSTGSGSAGSQVLYIAVNTGDVGTDMMSGGSLTVYGNSSYSNSSIEIGSAGTGKFVQTGGTVNTYGANGFAVGDCCGGTGVYDISGGSLTVNQNPTLGAGSGNAFVGAHSAGIMNQSGTATVSIAGGLYVGLDSTGTYTLSSTGGLTVGASGVGDLNIGANSDGTGTFNNNGSKNTVNGNLTVGSAGTGNYNLGNGVPGASLNVNGSGLSGGNVDVGLTGTGTITASDGSTATITGVLSVGGPSPGETMGNGTLTVTGSGTTWTNQQQAQIGGFGTGTLNVLAGAHFESDPGTSGSGTSGVLGTQGPDDGLADPTAHGYATVSGANSEWNNTGALRVGVYGTGSLTISNGGLVVDHAGTDGAAASVGWRAGSAGTVTLVNNSTWTNYGDLNVGDAGTGTVTMDSTSTITLTGQLDLGKQSTGNGTFNLNNDVLNAQGLTVGDAGSGQFNQSGGSATITGNLVAGNQTGSGGYVTLGGSGSPSLTVTGNATFGNNGYGSLYETPGATVDIRGSMAIADSTAGGGAAIEGGSLTVGDGGSGKELLIGSSGSMKIEDTGGVGASVTVDGALVNNGQLALGLHDVSPSSTLTVTQGLQNNGSFNFSANGLLNANVTNGSLTNSTAQIFVDNGAGTNVTLNGNLSNDALVNVAELGLAPSTFNQNGTFTNLAGGIFQVTDGIVNIHGGTNHALDNAGTVTIENDPNSGTTPAYQPSAVALNGNVTNGMSGNFSIQGSNVAITGNGNAQPALDNAGTFSITSGYNARSSTLTVGGGAVANEATGVMNVTNGSMTVNSSGSISNAGQFVVASNGSVSGAGTFTQTGGVSQINGSLTQSQINVLGGTLFGNGTISGPLSNSGGLVQGGAANSPGLLSVNGNVSQGSGGTLQELIDGTGSGQYSVLGISGSMGVDGTLDIFTGSGFNFVAGETFTIATFNPGNLTGQFATVEYGSYSGTGTSLNIGSGLTLDVLYNNTPGNIQLQVASVPEPEDAMLMIAGLTLIGFVVRRRSLAGGLV